MKSIMKFLRTINPSKAAIAFRNLLISVGGISIAVFIGTCHWYMYAPAALFIFATWYILYLIESHPFRDSIQYTIENSVAFRRIHNGNTNL